MATGGTRGEPRLLAVGGMSNESAGKSLPVTNEGYFSMSE